MKRLTNYLWIAYTLALIAAFLVMTLYGVLASINLDEVVASIKQLPSSTLRLPLIGKVFIGLGIWLASVIVPFIVYKHLVKPPDEGPGIEWLFFFTLIWPPA